MPAGQPALQVKNLQVKYRDKLALTDVNFSLPTGRFVGLLGPNGAGKTTLLRTLLGQIKPSQGQIELAGGTIGYVPQRHNFAWDYPIDAASVVLTGLTKTRKWWRGVDAQSWLQVKAALTQVGLAHRATSCIGSLSGGQRQRVLIARALVTNPQVLLLDEPFTGCDQVAVDNLMEIFSQLTKQGTTILMSTHDLPGALAGCDELLLLRRTVIAHGTLSQLQNPEVWQQAFEVKAGAPLLQVVAAFGGAAC